MSDKNDSVPPNIIFHQPNLQQMTVYAFTTQDALAGWLPNLPSQNTMPEVPCQMQDQLHNGAQQTGTATNSASQPTKPADTINVAHATHGNNRHKKRRPEDPEIVHWCKAF